MTDKMNVLDVMEDAASYIACSGPTSYDDADDLLQSRDIVAELIEAGNELIKAFRHDGESDPRDVISALVMKQERLHRLNALKEALRLAEGDK